LRVRREPIVSVGPVLLEKIRLKKKNCL